MQLVTFSLAAFYILSLSFIFAILIKMCLAILSGLECLFPFPDQGSFQLLCLQICSLSPPFFVFAFWDSSIASVICLMLSQRSLKLFSFVFIFISFFLFRIRISTALSSSSLMGFSVLFILLLISTVYFSIVLFFISGWLLFIFSNSLLQTSIFLLHVHSSLKFFDYLYSHYSELFL